MFALQLGKNFARTIAGPVVHADQFEIDRYSEYFPDDFAKSSTLIVNRHHDREFHDNSATV